MISRIARKNFGSHRSKFRSSNLKSQEALKYRVECLEAVGTLLIRYGSEKLLNDLENAIENASRQAKVLLGGSRE